MKGSRSPDPMLELDDKTIMSLQKKYFTNPEPFAQTSGTVREQEEPVSPKTMPSNKASPDNAAKKRKTNPEDDDDDAPLPNLQRVEDESTAAASKASGQIQDPHDERRCKRSVIASLKTGMQTLSGLKCPDKDKLPSERSAE